MLSCKENDLPVKKVPVPSELQVWPLTHLESGSFHCMTSIVMLELFKNKNIILKTMFAYKSIECLHQLKASDCCSISLNPYMVFQTSKSGIME